LGGGYPTRGSTLSAQNNKEIWEAVIKHVILISNEISQMKWDSAQLGVKAPNPHLLNLWKSVKLSSTSYFLLIIKKCHKQIGYIRN